MSEMPKFDFSKSALKSDDDLTAVSGEGAGKKEKFLKPGRYDVKIAALEFQGVAKNDANWGNMLAVYETADGRSIRDYFMIPFSDHLYGEKKTAFPFQKLVKIAAAYGQALTVANTADVMKALFAKPEKLVGMPVTIEVGFEGGFIHYAGKNRDGGKRFQIYGADHNPVRDAATMTPIEFPDFSAAEQYATANNLNFDKWPRVLQIARSAAAVAKPAVASNW